VKVFEEIGVAMSDRGASVRRKSMSGRPPMVAIGSSSGGRFVFQIQEEIFDDHHHHRL
jgi:hypothetical protein